MARAGKTLIIIFSCLLGAIELVDLALIIAHDPSPEELFGAELEEMDPADVQEIRDEAKKEKYKGIVRSIGPMILIGALVAGLCAGKNGARIALAVILFIRTALNACCGALLFAGGPLMGMNLSAILPELILLGFMVAIYPTVGVTLLVSQSIKAYCD